MLWFDEYERRARVAPGLLAVLPIAIAGTVLGLRENAIVGALIGLVAAAGGPLVLAGYVRQRGLNLQAHLVGSWGGMPTTALLLLTIPTDNEALRGQRRLAVERLAGTALPSADEERTNPQQANERIEAAVAVVREKTRVQQRFPLVFAENRNYGFERNLLALRPIGVVIASASFVLLALVAVVVQVRDMTAPPLAAVGFGIAVVVVMGVAWLSYPTEDRVRQAGRRYATALLDGATVADP